MSEMAINPETALWRAREYGRKFYRNSMVSILRCDDARCRALGRLTSSRSQRVRDMATRIMALDNTYRHYRYLNAASMRELDLLAQHPQVVNRFGGVA